MGPAHDGERGRQARAGDLVDPELGPWASRWRAATARLREIDTALDGRPDDVPLLLERAGLVELLGSREDAIAAYVDVLRRDAFDHDAMVRFGTLLVNDGKTQAARTVFAEAVQRHPHSPHAHLGLANLLVDAGETELARRVYERAIALDPQMREAHRGMAILLERAGEYAQAREAWERGFPDGAITVNAYRGQGPPRRVLVTTSAIGGNIPLQYVLDDALFEVAILIAEAWTPAMRLPPHDLVFNAIGDADRCMHQLERAELALAGTPAPVLNPPARVRETTRAANAARLARLDDVIAPRMQAFARATLAGPDAEAVLAAAGFGFPLLLRSPGFQTGEHFVKLDAPGALAPALAELPGDALLAIEFVDTRDAGGTARKYRVMTIDGVLYPLHLAISDDWKVHHFTAGMDESAERRAEEAAFLAGMDLTLGARAVRALERVAAALGLDYAGIDFGLHQDGRIVVYEANATMVILPPRDEARWEYRRPAFERALGATRAMLARTRAAT